MRASCCLEGAGVVAAVLLLLLAPASIDAVRCDALTSDHLVQKCGSRYFDLRDLKVPDGSNLLTSWDTVHGYRYYVQFEGTGVPKKLPNCTVSDDTNNLGVQVRLDGGGCYRLGSIDQMEFHFNEHTDEVFVTAAGGDEYIYGGSGYRAMNISVTCYFHTRFPIFSVFDEVDNTYLFGLNLPRERCTTELPADLAHHSSDHEGGQDSGGIHPYAHEDSGTVTTSDRQDESSSALSLGAILGIALGGAAVISIAIGAFVVKKRRSRAMRYSAFQTHDTGTGNNPSISHNNPIATINSKDQHGAAMAMQQHHNASRPHSPQTDPSSHLPRNTGAAFGTHPPLAPGMPTTASSPMGMGMGMGNPMHPSTTMAPMHSTAMYPQPTPVHVSAGSVSTAAPTTDTPVAPVVGAPPAHTSPQREE